MTYTWIARFSIGPIRLRWCLKTVEMSWAAEESMQSWFCWKGTLWRHSISLHISKGKEHLCISKRERISNKCNLEGSWEKKREICLEIWWKFLRKCWSGWLRTYFKRSERRNEGYCWNGWVLFHMQICLASFGSALQMAFSHCTFLFALLLYFL